jgi:phosphopantothenoylcysteine decarboxylase/phosphopantothenate--cysteine ligase
LGSRVIVVAGKLSVPVPTGAELIVAETAAAMELACRNLVEEHKPRLFLAAAAVGDWRPVNPSASKVSTSSGRLIIEFEPTPKIVDQVKAWSPSTFLVVFRAQSGLSDEDLLSDAVARLIKAKGDLIASNDTSRPGEGFEAETNCLLLVDTKGSWERLELATKLEVAQSLLAKIERMLYI